MIGIIFDCDGTLIDSELAHFLSWQKALYLRNRAFTKEDYFQLAGHPGKYIAQKLHEQIPLDSPEALKRDNSDYYLKLHAQGIPPIERTVRFVQELGRLKEKLG